MSTLNEARGAKEKAKTDLADLPELNGIGVTKIEGGYGIKVNLKSPSSRPIPTTFDGVPVISEISGSVIART
jgi:hypothetical protein